MKARGCTKADIDRAVQILLDNAVKPVLINGEMCYVMRLPQSNVQSAFELGLAPFSVLDVDDNPLILALIWPSRQEPEPPAGPQSPPAVTSEPKQRRSPRRRPPSRPGRSA